MTKRFEVGRPSSRSSRSTRSTATRASSGSREITDGQARIGQLSSQYDGFIGTDTWIDLDDPELIAPQPGDSAALARRHN
ncbi:hypothetical protein Isolate57596_51530 (plasmid) [Mycobacteroides abscessus subsp. abscessus]